MISVGVKVTEGIDLVGKLVNDMATLGKKEVMVGIPESEDAREDPGIGNAALAYIHDKGSPLNGIPARPFMEPGIRKARDPINTHMLSAAKAQMNDKPEEANIYLHRVGQVAENSVKRVITKGEGFAPIKRSTKLARLRKSKTAGGWTKEKRESVMDEMKPLIETASMRNAITHVVGG